MDSLVSVEARDRFISAGDKSVTGALEDRPLVVVIDRTATKTSSDAIAQQDPQVVGIDMGVNRGKANRFASQAIRKSNVLMNATRLDRGPDWRDGGCRSKRCDQSESDSNSPPLSNGLCGFRPS